MRERTSLFSNQQVLNSLIWNRSSFEVIYFPSKNTERLNSFIRPCSPRLSQLIEFRRSLGAPSSSSPQFNKSEKKCFLKPHKYSYIGNWSEHIIFNLLHSLLHFHFYLKSSISIELCIHSNVTFCQYYIYNIYCRSAERLTCSADLWWFTVQASNL